MKLEVQVIAGAKTQMLKQDGSMLKIYLRAPAVEGKANKALIDFLAAHFGVRRSKVQIIKGLKSTHKTINIKS